MARRFSSLKRRGDCIGEEDRRREGRVDEGDGGDADDPEGLEALRGRVAEAGGERGGGGADAGGGGGGSGGSGGGGGEREEEEYNLVLGMPGVCVGLRHLIMCVGWGLPHTSRIQS